MANAIRAHLLETVKVWAEVNTLLQNRPFTAVEVISVVEGKEYTATGFSKVCWPDSWDEEFGKKLAFEKACGNIVRQILKEWAEAKKKEVESKKKESVGPHVMAV